MSIDLLPRAFFARDALDVARDLIGKRLRHGGVTVEITETEAYRVGDSAAHTRHGKTARNAPVWGPPGCAYIYVCYGIHRMLNLSTNEDGVGACVLVRAARPVAGLDLIIARRGGMAPGPALLTGPGKVGRALDLDLPMNHQDVTAPGGLEALDGPAPAGLLAGPRVGIDYAAPADRDARWRFALADTPWVSHRKGLTPVDPS